MENIKGEVAVMKDHSVVILQGDTQQNLGKLIFKTHIEMLDDIWPDIHVDVLLTDQYLILKDANNGEIFALLNKDECEILEHENSYIAFKYKGVLYVFESVEEPITVIDHGFKIKNRKIHGENFTFPIGGKEDVTELATGTLWHVIDKYNDKGSFILPEYYKGQKHNYVLYEGEVYVVDGMPVFGEQVATEEGWIEYPKLPKTVIKALERKMKIIETVPVPKVHSTITIPKPFDPYAGI